MYLYRNEFIPSFRQTQQWQNAETTTTNAAERAKEIDDNARQPQTAHQQKTGQHLQPKTKLIGDHLWKIIAMLSVIANYTLLILGIKVIATTTTTATKRRFIRKTRTQWRECMKKPNCCREEYNYLSSRMGLRYRFSRTRRHRQFEDKRWWILRQWVGFRLLSSISLPSIASFSRFSNFHTFTEKNNFGVAKYYLLQLISDR
jgi:hypothetical protein